MHARLYKPGTHVIDLTLPGAIEKLLDFHRATFGSAVMRTNEPGAGGEGGTGGTGTGGTGGTGTGDGGTGTGTGEGGSGSGTGEPQLNEHGYPDKTPVKDMPVDQQAAYWKHHARKHEERANAAADYDAVKAENARLKAATQTDAEKAIDAAKEEGRAEVRAETLPNLVKAEFRAVAANKIPQDRLADIVAPLDLTKFLSADGSEVDTDKVQKYVDGLAPGGAWPDMGQGRRSDKKVKGVGAGAALYTDRHTKK